MTGLVVNEGTRVGGRAESITHARGIDTGGQLFDESAVDGLVDEDAVGCDADLSRNEEFKSH